MATTYYHTVDGRIRGETTAGVRTDYLTDALGSVVATVNSSAQVVNTYRYKPYGERLAKTGVGADPSFLWTGDTGSRRTNRSNADYYNRTRQFGSSQGRWTSIDSIWPAGGGAYGYAIANPITYRDPSGMVPVRENKGYGGDCCGLGGLQWFFSLEPMTGDGWLIQRVERTYGGKTCAGDSLPRDCPPVLFEAWKVIHGVILLPGPGGTWILPIESNHDHWTFTKGGGCTHGSHTIHGELMLLTGALPKSFKRNNPEVRNCAGDLPASLTFPGWKSEGAPGDFKIVWACCGKQPNCPPPNHTQCDDCPDPGDCTDPSITASPNSGYPADVQCP